MRDTSQRQTAEQTHGFKPSICKRNERMKGLALETLCFEATPFDGERVGRGGTKRLREP